MAKGTSHTKSRPDWQTQVLSLESDIRSGGAGVGSGNGFGEESSHPDKGLDVRGELGDLMDRDVMTGREMSLVPDC